MLTASLSTRDDMHVFMRNEVHKVRCNSIKYYTNLFKASPYLCNLVEIEWGLPLPLVL